MISGTCLKASRSAGREIRSAIQRRTSQTRWASVTAAAEAGRGHERPDVLADEARDRRRRDQHERLDEPDPEQRAAGAKGGEDDLEVPARVREQQERAEHRQRRAQEVGTVQRSREHHRADRGQDRHHRRGQPERHREHRDEQPGHRRSAGRLRAQHADERGTLTQVGERPRRQRGRGHQRELADGRHAVEPRDHDARHDPDRGRDEEAQAAEAQAGPEAPAYGVRAPSPLTSVAGAAWRRWPPSARRSRSGASPGCRPASRARAARPRPRGRRTGSARAPP